MTREDQANKPAKLVDGGIVVFLFMFAVFAPHSIAATQIAWLLAMLFWVLRFAFPPRPKLHKTPLDYPLLAFFILTGVSAFLSYEPMASIGKVRAVSLFTIVYVLAENVRSLRVLRLLALTLVFSCMINVLYTAGERLLGRAVKVHGVSEISPLYKAGIRDGDTLLQVDGQPLRDPQELVNAISKADMQPAVVVTYRHELVLAYKVPRGTTLSGNSTVEQLGIKSWSRGRDWRASGFFGHYVTYAEVLQLILALALGLFVSLPMKKSWMGAALIIALAGFCFALLLTVTRAPWAGCLLSSAIILLLGTSRRTILIIAILAIPLILAGFFLLQQKRNVAFLDKKDDSTTWRETVWREGFHLLVSKPRHVLIGVGMDSIKGHWREWGMFNHGKIPIGHMHSNLLQIALERGIPALLLWLILLLVYVRMLWRSQQSSQHGWIERGISLGALGGLVGFFISGLVHYNWGDSEVVMVLYFIMGLSLAVRQLSRNKSALRPINDKRATSIINSS